MAAALALPLLALATLSSSASQAPGPCTALAPGKGVDTLDLYRRSIDAEEERAISASEVRLCGLEETPTHLRFHVHVEWITHGEAGDYWIPTSEISGPGGIRPDTPILRPSTFPAGTLGELEPAETRGIIVTIAMHGGTPRPAGAARGPERERRADLMRLMVEAREGNAVASGFVMLEPASKPGWLRPSADDVRMVQVSVAAAGADAGARSAEPLDASPDAVKRLQWVLNRAGARLKPDGVMGLQTAMALADFQKAHGLKPTGRLDPTSRRLLGLEGEGKQAKATLVPQ